MNDQPTLTAEEVATLQRVAAHFADDPSWKLVQTLLRERGQLRVAIRSFLDALPEGFTPPATLQELVGPPS